MKNYIYTRPKQKSFSQIVRELLPGETIYVSPREFKHPAIVVSRLRKEGYLIEITTRGLLEGVNIKKVRNPSLDLISHFY